MSTAVYQHSFRCVIFVDDEPNAVVLTLNYTQHRGSPMLRERGTGVPLAPPEPPGIEPISLFYGKTSLPMELLSDEQIYTLQAKILEE